MKRFYFVLLFTALLGSGVSAQSVITVHPASYPNACDGWASLDDTTGISTWTWFTISPDTIAFNPDSLSTGDICEGSYLITYTDGTGQHSEGFTIDNACSNFQVSATVTPNTGGMLCNGNIVSSVSGGPAPYVYSWSNGVTTANQTGLCSGTYTVIVTDQAGCTATGSYTVTDGCSLSVTASQTPASDPMTCNGNLTAFSMGNNGNVSYSWSNGSTDSLVENLCPGMYTLIVTDAAGCMDSITVTLTDSTSNPCLGFGVNGTVTPVSAPGLCNGSANAYTYGGMAPYTYLWDNGSTSASVGNLCPGYSTLTATDANGCSATWTAAITADSLNGMFLTGYVATWNESTQGSCDGSAEVYVYGGTPSYTYYHSNGAATAAVSGLCAGIYSVMVVDGNGDTLVLDYLISSPSNTIINLPYPDSTVIDSLWGNLIADCTIDYNSITAAMIDSSNWISSDSIAVTWAVYSSSGVDYITEIYYAGAGNGVYELSLSVYCPQKSVDQYLKIYDQLYVGDALGIAEPFAGNPVTIFPNPFSESLSVSFGKPGDYTAVLCDMTGRVLLNAQTKTSDELKLQSLDRLAKGEYLLLITGETGTIAQKVVK